MKARELKEGKEYKIFDYHEYRLRGKRDVSKFIFAVFDGRIRTVGGRCVYRFIDREGFYYSYFGYELKADVMEVSECNEIQSKL